MTTTSSASLFRGSEMRSDPQSQLIRAKKTAYNILAYADNTEATLRRKLAQRGYPDDIISAAVEEVRASGALNEERMLRSRLTYLVETKKYGKRRVILELRRMGFPRELIERADWDSFDFAEICAGLITKAGGLDEKLYGSLLRRGFSPSEIKTAAKMAENNWKN